MRPVILPLALAALTACQSVAPPPDQEPAALDAPARIALAGRGRERAAYTAYALALFELQLTYLEALPEGWFPGTEEFEEARHQIEALTGIAPSGPAEDFDALARDARAWTDWHIERRDQLAPGEQMQRDRLFGRLMGTTPFLFSTEFRDIVRSLGQLSGLAPSWRGEPGAERYESWAQFTRDLRTWHSWFNENHERLEWNVGAHQLRPGRGLGNLTPPSLQGRGAGGLGPEEQPL